MDFVKILVVYGVYIRFWPTLIMWHAKRDPLIFSAMHSALDMLEVLAQVLHSFSG